MRQAHDIDQLLRHDDFVRRLARRLAFDQAEADDLVQETWLAAIRNPPQDMGQPRAWLSRVVRNLASKKRRGALPVVEAERALHIVQSPREDEPWLYDMRTRLANAFNALSARYRLALQLRYYDGLGLDQVAARLGVPVETARTRLRRGLGHLRSRMHAEVEQPGRRRFMSWIVPFWRGRKGRGTVAPARAWWLGLAALHAVAAVLFFVVRPDASGRTAGPEAEPRPGSSVDIAARGLHATTPAGGSVAHAEMPARGKGAFREVVGTVPRVIRVADQYSQPHAGATVTARFIDGAGEIVELGLTDSRGELAVGLPRGERVVLGARKEGFRAPFSIVYGEHAAAPEGAPLRLLLRDQKVGERLPRLLVVDPDGEAIAGASVRHVRDAADSGPYLATGGIRWAEETLYRTGDDGRATIVGLDASSVPVIGLVVSAPGFAPAYVSAARLGGKGSELRLQLGPGATLTGVVRGPSGTALPGVVVSARGSGFLAPVTAITEADGAYTLSPLAEGRWEVWAVDRTRGLSSGGLVARDLTPGLHQWSAVLHSGGVIEGRLLAASGRPLAGRTVELVEEASLPRDLLGWTVSPSPTPRSVRTDAEGRYRFGGCAPTEHRVRSIVERDGTAVPEAQRSGAHPDRAPVDLRLDPHQRPTAGIRCRFPDESSGRPILWSEEFRIALPLLPNGTGGRYERSGLPPGPWELYTTYDSVADRPLVSLASVELEAGLVTDVGRVTPPERGSIAVELVCPDGVAPTGARYRVDRGWWRIARLKVENDPLWDYARLDDHRFELRNLTAGVKLLELSVPGYADVVREVLVTPGAVSTQRIEMKRGVNIKIALQLPPELDGLKRLQLWIRRDDGTVAGRVDRMVGSATGRDIVQRCLLPGRYVLEGNLGELELVRRPFGVRAKRRSQQITMRVRDDGLPPGGEDAARVSRGRRLGGARSGR